MSTTTKKQLAEKKLQREEQKREDVAEKIASKIVPALEDVKKAVQGIKPVELKENKIELPQVQKVEVINQKDNSDKIIQLQENIIERIEKPATIANTFKEPVPVILVKDGKPFDLENMKAEDRAILLGGSDQFGQLTWQQVKKINDEGVKISDNYNIDSFGKLITVEGENLFDSKQLHDSQPLFWDDQEVSGGGTSSAHDSNICERS